MGYTRTFSALALAGAVSACASTNHAPEGLPEAPTLRAPTALGCDDMDVNKHYASASNAQGRSGRVVNDNIAVSVDGDVTFVQPPQGAFTVGYGYGAAQSAQDDAKLIGESIGVYDTGNGVDGIKFVVADVGANDAGKVVPVTIDLVRGQDVATSIALRPDAHGFVSAEFDKTSFGGVQIQGLNIGSGDASLTLTSAMTYELERRQCSDGNDNGNGGESPGKDGPSTGSGEVDGGTSTLGSLMPTHDEMVVSFG